MTQGGVATSAEDLKADATLPRALVHKRAVHQVFVTDWMYGPGDTLATVAAQLPLSHIRFSDSVAPYHDIVLMAETVRQAGLVMGVEVVGVPLEFQFLLRQMRLQLDPLEHNRRTRETCDMTFSTDPSSVIKDRPGRASIGGMLRLNCSIAGRPSGVCEVVGAWVPAAVYSGFRGGTDPESGAGVPEPAVHGERELLTGRASPRNSVITPVQPTGEPGEFSALTVVDRDDPTFFDHPLDHIPGLLMLEALHQTTIAGACRELGTEPGSLVVSGLELKFQRLAEFVPDAVCTSRLAESGDSAEVRIMQGGRTCCEGRMDVTRV